MLFKYKGKKPQLNNDDNDNVLLEEKIVRDCTECVAYDRKGSACYDV